MNSAAYFETTNSSMPHTRIPKSVAVPGLPASDPQGAVSDAKKKLGL